MTPVQVIVEPMEIPGMGRFAFFLDPSGGGIGAWHASVSVEEPDTDY